MFFHILSFCSWFISHNVFAVILIHICANLKYLFLDIILPEPLYVVSMYAEIFTLNFPNCFRDMNSLLVVG